MGTAYSKYFAKPCFMRNRKQRFSYEKSQTTVFTWKIANNDFHRKQRFSSQTTIFIWKIASNGFHMKNRKPRFSYEKLQTTIFWIFKGSERLEKKEWKCAFTIFSAKPCFTKRYPQNLVKKYEPAYTRTISLKPCFMKNRKEQFSELIPGTSAWRGKPIHFCFDWIFVTLLYVSSSWVWNA